MDNRDANSGTLGKQVPRNMRRRPELGERDRSRLLEFGYIPPEGMVAVPPGEFTMGAVEPDRESSMDESPEHVVHLDAFAIDIHPVTVGEFRRFCDAAGRRMPKPPYWGWVQDHPMVCVNWNDAVEYAIWVGKRLPTEAEWEKAARGVDGRAFPWGNRWDKHAAHCMYRHECPSLHRTAPVGSHPEGASPYGCYDMIGNVWEWCSDLYDGGYYGRSPHRNPPGPSRGEPMAMGQGLLWREEAECRSGRGGCWRTSKVGGLRCFTRGFNVPYIRNERVGFRCAVDL